MSFTPFLRRIARYYASVPPERLPGICFVFPNQRSGYFFTEYLREALEEHGKKSILMPPITTMSSLVERWCGLVEGSETELMILLLRTYLDITSPQIKDAETGRSVLDPDRFLFWSEIILNDFNDIDRSLADASHLYRNLKDIKELQTNPLTSEQLELIKRFWNTTGVSWIETTGVDARMWVNAGGENDRNDGVRNFLKLWEILGPLYEAYREKLAKNGMCYMGMAYRMAVSRLRTILENDLPLSRGLYVFIGFSSLTESEKEIFHLLKKYGHAAFHWDVNMPPLGVDEDFPLRLVKSYRNSFPEPEDFEPVVCDNSPDIDIYSVPSEIGQVKQVASLLNNDEELCRENALRYAVILPESALCLPLLGSLDLPDDVKANITMGFPMKNTPMASVMESLATMRSTTAIRGKETMFYKPAVENLLSQPLLMKCGGNECATLLYKISKVKGLFVKGERLLEWSSRLSFLFAGGNGEDSRWALSRIVDDTEALQNLYREAEKSGNPEAEPRTSLEYEFLEAYRNKTREFVTLIEKYHLYDSLVNAGSSVWGALEKMLRRLTLSFVGTPLEGIQVMGVLETRALDFEYIFITSMNERSFPRKLQKPTFIPQNLREAYGLEHRLDEETVMAYHFYRLIGRAKKVTLLYNRSSEGLKSGEPSRYIYQLRYLYDCPSLKEYTLNYVSWTPTRHPIVIDKTDAVMERLELFKSGTPGKSGLSASSIKKLFSCGLDFFLSKLCGYSDPDDEDDSHINDSMYGTIVHRIMQDLYMAQPAMLHDGKEKPCISPSVIDRILKTNAAERFATRAVNREYLELEEDRLDNIPEGEMLLFRDMAVRSVKAMLLAEKKYLVDNGHPYLLFEQAEVNRQIDFKVDDEISVKFTYIIDRVDRIFNADGSSFLRIVDYKTGSDVLDFQGVESLLDFSAAGENDRPPKAVMQLMLYSIAFARDGVNNVSPDERIQPMIYKFRDIANGADIEPITFRIPGERKDIPLTDYRIIEKEFTQSFAKKMHDLFNRDIPFVMASGRNACRYCEFKEICARDI